ncbi:MAG: hypothetical protein H6595_12145 [Flavobacteriales bacterium]|nr:hypothetical protein [Flavobacteriales bacterium]MCB9168213.1 hypothetical protein [Flavobacteriales bacterium]
MRIPNEQITKGLTLFTIIGTLLFACSPEAESDQLKEKVDRKVEQLDKATAQDMERTRTELTQELKELRVRIDDRLIKIEEQLGEKDLSTEKRKELEGARDILKEQQRRIAMATSKIGTATRDTWNEVKDGTTKLVNEVGDWFVRQAEAVDQKTGTDHDKDGH